MKSQFGELINSKRRTKRLTLRQVSQLVGISPGFLSEIENGIKLPPKHSETIERLSLVLDIPYERLQGMADSDRAVGKAAGFFSSIFGNNNELAYALYRATEDQPEEKLEDLRERLKKAIEAWGEGTPNDE